MSEEYRLNEQGFKELLNLITYLQFSCFNQDLG